MKRGENVSDKRLGIRRELLVRICDELLKQGTAEALEERAIILMLYHAVGRGGEVATTNLDIMHWEENDKMLWSGWNQMKTGRGTELSFTSDSLNFEIDFLHALAAYIVTAGGSLASDPASDEPAWLFPGYTDLKNGGAASKVSRILKDLVGVVEGLDELHASHGLRVGPTDDLAMNIAVNIVSIIARGDWHWEGECMVFNYITQRLHVSEAGTSNIAKHAPLLALLLLTACLASQGGRLLGGRILVPRFLLRLSTRSSTTQTATRWRP